MNTLVEYMYRDASNYKEVGRFVLGGRFDVSMIEPFLSDRKFFIPERVGVKALVPATKRPTITISIRLRRPWKRMMLHAW